MGKLERQISKLKTTAEKPRSLDGLSEQFKSAKNLEDKIFGNIANSPFYYYTHYPSSLDCFKTLKLTLSEIAPNDPESIKWDNAHILTFPNFYEYMRPTVKDFQKNQFFLRDDAFPNKEFIPLNELSHLGKTLLEPNYNLVKNFVKLNNAPVDSRMGRSHSILQRMRITEEIKKMPPKSEDYRESMRRYIPRWLHHPLEYPEGVELDEATQKLWSGYSPKDAHLLIHPDQLAQGRAPFHMAMRAASALEQEGKGEIAYDLRVSIINQTLTMEKGKLDQPNPEHLFFTYIFGGAMAGDLGKPPKDAHFDYQGALKETLRQTFIRLDEELKDEKPGKALNFLQGLYRFYADDLSGLVGRAVMTSHISTLDPMNIINQLSQKDLPWTKSIKKTLVDLPTRTVMNSREVEHFASMLPTQTKPTLDEQYTNIETMLGDADIYSFKTKIIEKNKPPISLQIELDRTSEYVDALLRFESRGQVRFVPFQFSFSGEPESFQIEGIEGKISHETIEQYLGVVINTIKSEADGIRAREKKKSQQEKQSFSTRVDDESGLQVKLLTREDRLALYAATKGKERKRGKLKQLPTEDVVFPASDTTPIQKEVSKKEIIGLNKATVDELLKAQRIEVVSSDEVINVLTKHVDKSSTHGTMLGKRLRLYWIRELDKESPLHKKLRQINWYSGSNAIRVYIEDLDHGKFALRGILLKKNDEQQSRYIKKLVLELQEQHKQQT